MAARPRVLVTVPWAGSALGSRVDVVQGPLGARTDIEGLLIGPTDALGPEVIASLGELRVVAVAGSGLDAVDVETLAERGIRLVSAPEPTAAPTAEITLALLLMVSRSIPQSIRRLRAGEWPGWTFDDVAGRGLSGLTLGLVGFGRIGREVARLAEPFGMQVLHHCRTPSGEKGYRADLHAMLRESDVVSLHVPLSETTRHLIGETEIGLLPTGAAIINTSRGGVLDEAVVIEALADGRLSGAGIDVFQSEPGLPTALMQAPNVVLTPHIGTATVEARTAMVEMAAQKLLDALQV